MKIGDKVKCISGPRLGVGTILEVKLRVKVGELLYMTTLGGND